MRQDSLDIQAAEQQPSREPRYVVGIIYGVSSPYFTSKHGLTNVPGVPVYGVLESIGGTTQEVNPDEGRATIGDFHFSVVDFAGEVTDELRDQLTSNDEGPRWNEVRVFRGFTDDFNDYQRIATYRLSDVQVAGHTYQFACVDIQRLLREQVFEPKSTRLTADLAIDATSATVHDTSDFDLVAHTAAFTDAPSATVGYFRVKKTGEIIRYTGKTAGSFTGLTRGVLGTIAAAMIIDPDAELDQLPEIEEVVYLEMPGPELAYAILTGVIRSSTASPQDTLPEHWHVGVAESLVDGDRFDQIGLDLVDPADATAGLVFSFYNLDAWDGKQFIEEQLMFPMGCFMPIDVLGRIGIRRFPRILTNAPEVERLTVGNVVNFSALQHDQASVVNQIEIEWNHDGEDFTRRTRLQDASSIARNGASTIRKYELYGVRVTRHTTALMQRIGRTVFDRYAEPPERLQVQALPSLSALEVADVVRCVLPVRDYQGTDTLDRSMEIQSAANDWMTGNISLQLFGSAREIEAEAPGGATPALGSDWITSQGVALSSVLTMVGDTVTANGNLAGHADLNNASAIYYHDGDLILGAGVTVTYNLNVQIRARTITTNGKWDGKGRGLAGIAEPNTIGVLMQNYPDPRSLGGFLGTTRGSAGVHHSNNFGGLYTNLRGGLLQGEHNAAPVIDIVVAGTLDSPPTPELVGLPADLRGAPGMYGAPVVGTGSYTVRARGGAGGASGAGLVLAAESISFGASGQIDASGADGVAPSATATLGGIELYAGAGGGGAPGTTYFLLTDPAAPYPDVAGKLVANRGACPVTGTPGVFEGFSMVFASQPGTGLAGTELAAESHADSAHQIQYIPVEGGLGEGADESVPAVTSLTATVDGHGVLLRVGLPPANEFDYIEIYESIDNDRSNAVRLVRISGDEFFRGSATAITRYYWVRPLDEARGYGPFFPASSTAGVAATFGGAAGPAGDDGDDGADGAAGAFTVNADPFFTSVAKWFGATGDVPDESVPISSEFSIVTLTDGAFGRTALRHNGGTRSVFFSELVPIDQARTYRISVIARQASAAPDHFLLVAFYDAAGALINNASSPVSDATGWAVIGGDHYWEISALPFGTTFTQYEFTFGANGAATFPSNAVACRIGALINVNNDTAENIDLQAYRLELIADTMGIEYNAATGTYSVTDLGPITATLAGSAPDAVYQIKYVTVTTETGDVVEVTASYRVGVVSPGGAGWTVTHGVARMNTAGTSVNFAQATDKNGVNLYEPVASSGQFVQAAGTYRFGVGCRIQDSTAADVDAIFRDISISVAVIKR